MSNTNNEQTVNPFDPKSYVSKLNETFIPMNPYGFCFKETCQALEQKCEKLFQDNLGIPECDHVLIYPMVDERGGKLCEVKSFIYFDTSLPGASNIKRNGNVSGEGRKTVLDYSPSRGANGEFQTNDKFKEVFSPLAMLDDDGRIIIKRIPQDSRVAVIEVDFFLLMALVMDIPEDAPLNFTVLAVDSANIMRNNGYEDATILMMKYIDNRKRYGRNKGKGRKIDYRALDRSMVGGNSGRRDYN